ncbi:MAG: hypothetical protein LUG54_10980 [Clostridiales bacterium]|nr:hypothetical protein [Clostridiales bacterium]
MRSIIYQYLKDEEHLTDIIADQMCDKIEKHPEIMQELVSYIRTGAFPEESPVTVQGYTAQMIEESTFLKPIGAYNYLIYLKNKPEEALAKLQKGLSRR